MESAEKKSTIRLVPDLDSLRPHLERANYLAYVQQHYQLRSHPSPIGHGWHLANDLCLTIRYTKPPIPKSISLSTNPQTDDNSDSDSESVESESESYSSYSDSAGVSEADM